MYIFNRKIHSCFSFSCQRNKHSGEDESTRCIRCFNSASKKSYDTYFHLGIGQNFLTHSPGVSQDGSSLARKGAFLQTLAIGMLLSEAIFFFCFLFYSQFSLLLKLYRRLQNYLLLGKSSNNVHYNFPKFGLPVPELP